MGVITDFVVVKNAEVLRVYQPLNPRKDFSGVDAKGIDTVKLGTLYAILTDTKFDPTFMSNPVCQASEEGPWVFEVPHELTRRLAALNSTELRLIGAQWAATEEFSMKFGDWPPDAVNWFVLKLAAMCVQVLGEDKSVFMWMCL